MIILASNSPRRSQLLSLAGWQFNVQPAKIQESILPGETPFGYVSRLAEEKARVVLQAIEAQPVMNAWQRHRASASGSDFPPGGIILAADTAVVDGEVILGKPPMKMMHSGFCKDCEAANTWC